jgi:hypothetical protein
MEKQGKIFMKKHVLPRVSSGAPGMDFESCSEDKVVQSKNNKELFLKNQFLSGLPSCALVRLSG